MRRVKATQVQSHQPVYVDLDACVLIARGQLNEEIPGKAPRTLECTWLYFGNGMREAVDETPEQLFALPFDPPRRVFIRGSAINGYAAHDEVTGSPV